MNKKDGFWVVIPAAGVGKRMLVDHPKQYLQLESLTVIEHTLSKFSQHEKVSGIVVVISQGDEYWSSLNLDLDVPLFIAEGGVERCHSVLNGLKCLNDKAQASDWVMVHDAARPCLHTDDINKLIHELWSHPVGGLLGLPVADTLKFCDANRSVKKTVNRDGLWRALTPQMFRYQVLLDALSNAITHPETITDDASAMELAGFEPLMIEGRWDNIKITHPQDISQAQIILQAQRG